MSELDATGPMAAIGSEPAEAQMVVLPAEVSAAMGHLRLILKTVQQSLAQVKGHSGISGSQLWCLAAVARAPGIRVTQLAQTLDVRQATVSKLVEVLVRKRLLQRQRGEQDQRVVMLQVSPAGQQALLKAPVPAAGVLPQALLKMPVEHLQQLNGLLDELRLMLANDHGGSTAAPADAAAASASKRSRGGTRNDTREDRRNSAHATSRTPLADLLKQGPGRR